MTLDSYVS